MENRDWYKFDVPFKINAFILMIPEDVCDL